MRPPPRRDYGRTKRNRKALSRLIRREFIFIPDARVRDRKLRVDSSPPPPTGPGIRPGGEGGTINKYKPIGADKTIFYASGSGDLGPKIVLEKPTRVPNASRPIFRVSHSRNCAIRHLYYARTSKTKIYTITFVAPKSVAVRIGC